MNLQDLNEEAGDGYSNDFQRALEVSRLRHDSNRDEVLGLALFISGAGRFAVVEIYPAYCPITDAVVGDHYRLLGDYLTRKEAVEAVEANHDPDSAYRIFPEELPSVCS
jgi:hypothetical protein